MDDKNISEKKNLEINNNKSFNSLIVIGASAGGLGAIETICGNLPEEFPLPILIVWHLGEESKGYLPMILKKKSALTISNAENGERIEKGHIYVAPPNKHLLVEDGKVRTVFGPKENRFRPAIDPLFRSAAYSYDSNVIGIILSGSLNDGTAGLWSIKDQGGITIVQDPLNAQFGDMPLNAINNVDVDYSLPVEQIPGLLIKLSSQKPAKSKKESPVQKEKIGIEIDMIKNKIVKDNVINKIGKKSQFTCPECSGALWLIEDDKIIRFRCRIGHAYSLEAFLSDQEKTIETNVWKALQCLEENLNLFELLSKEAKKNGDNNKFKLYNSKKVDMNKKAENLHTLIFGEKL